MLAYGTVSAVVYDMRYLLATGLSVVFLAIGAASQGADWPMRRHDVSRSGVSEEELAEELHLQWVRRYPQLDPAWTDHPRMQFDAAYEPVVLGKTMYVGSSHNDTLTALDTDSGSERWRYYAGGPIRLAPTAWTQASGDRPGPRVCFVCDDGHLYCLDGGTGELLWKFRGAPTGKLLIGNGRLISAWPARGGPVLADGTIYFTASVWPLMGMFLYAVDAETGRPVWSVDRSGSTYAMRIRSGSFSGLAPEGYLVVSGSRLIVPGGRTNMSCFDRTTGALLYHTPRARAGFRTAVTGNVIIGDGYMYSAVTGRILSNLSVSVAVPLFKDLICALSTRTGNRLVGYTHGSSVKQGAPGSETHRLVVKPVWNVAVPAVVTDLIRAGAKMFACGPGYIKSYAVGSGKDAPRESWHFGLEEQPLVLAAADGKLFASTREGSIYCFGLGEKTSRTYERPEPAEVPGWKGAAGDAAGWCVILGLKTGDLAGKLADSPRARVVAVDADSEKVDRLRKKFDAAGLYGARVSVLVGDPSTIELPSYCASLVTSEDPGGAGLVSGKGVGNLFRILRPYGGTADLSLSSKDHGRFVSSVPEAQPGHAKIERSDGRTFLRRVGPLPGSADWTHLHGDPANTGISGDSLVKPPFGLLWFGGVSHERFLPRHGHGPTPNVVGGRVFMGGSDSLSAIDVYTGRLLWTAALPGVGRAYASTSHQPGANAVGGNVVAMPDGVYVIDGTACLRLDPETGKTLSRFRPPPDPAAKTARRVGYVGILGDILVLGVDPVMYQDIRRLGQFANWSGTRSKGLVAMDRTKGKVLWTSEAAFGYRHNAIVMGGGKVFCIDRSPPPEFGRKGEGGTPVLLALDVHKGTVLWRKEEGVFGTWLGYSEEHDLLLEAGRHSRDMLLREPKDRMAVHRGADGTAVWARSIVYSGPCLIRGDMIIAEIMALDLRTGKVRNRLNALTGTEAPWTLRRGYGCGGVIGSTHLLTFRSGEAGYFDLDRDGGTGNLGGFRAGCTPNLVVANGVLSAPDYTRTCSCPYAHQTSLALIHMPDMEMWTYNSYEWDRARVKRAGINFGAPGDRRAENGTLWLDFPSVGGPSPDIPVETDPADPGWFYRHSIRMEGEGLKWVASSGCRNLRRATVTLAEGPGTARYTVRLHFAEIEEGRPAFDVSLQGKKVLQGFDIAREAGGVWCPVVREFRKVEVGGNLTVAFDPPGFLSGIEMILEPESK